MDYEKMTMQEIRDEVKSGIIDADDFDYAMQQAKDRFDKQRFDCKDILEMLVRHTITNRPTCFELEEGTEEQAITYVLNKMVNDPMFFEDVQTRIFYDLLADFDGYSNWS